MYKRQAEHGTERWIILRIQVIWKNYFVQDTGDHPVSYTHLKNIRTLEELNRLWAVYLEEYYHKQKHAGIADVYKRQV